METEAIVDEREEGEIDENPEDELNTEVDLYVPLERPVMPCIPPTGEEDVVTSDREDNQDSSSSDSDTTVRRSSFSRNKKKPLERTNQACLGVSSQKKRNTIWCTDIQTEVLTKDLVRCNVDKDVDRTRDVEYYDYKLAAAIFENDRRKNPNKQFKEYIAPKERNVGVNSKRKVDGQFVDCERSKHKTVFNTKAKGVARHLLPLSKGAADDEEGLATDIANKLCEEKEELILRALQIVGKKNVIALFEETKRVEQNGGMLILNGTRRRTPGGVFFYLLKTSETIPQDLVTEVFADHKRLVAVERKKVAREIMKARAKKRREAMSKDDFPTLLSKTELVIKEFKAKKEKEKLIKTEGVEVKEEEEVKNPPPSPATDGRDNSSDGEEKDASVRVLTSYGDNLFDYEDNMDTA